MDRSGVAKRKIFGSCSTTPNTRIKTSVKELSTCCLSSPSPSPSPSLSSSSSSIDNLSDELLVEILLRCPAKFLHRCKSVSKHWLCLISDPYFARSFIIRRQGEYNIMLLFKIRHPPPDVGQLYTFPLLQHAQPSSSLPLTFDLVPSLCQNNYSYDPNIRCFCISDKVFEGVDFKATYAGLVLVQGVFRQHVNSTTFFRLPSDYQYYVCSPVTKQWVELPSISTPGYIGFACYYFKAPHSRIWADLTCYDNIVTQNTDYNPNMIDFTVISVRAHPHADFFIIHVFSSEDDIPDWSIFHVPRPPDPAWFSDPDAVKVVFCYGKFHWVGNDCVIVYDPFNNPLECHIIPLPPIDSPVPGDYYTISLEAYQGHLRLVISFLVPSFLVFELVDYDYANNKSSWVIKYDYNDIDEDYLLTYGGAVGDDKIYILDDYSFDILLCDLKNASLQHVYSCPIPMQGSSFLYFFEPFLSSPWPTPVPMRHRK